MRANKGSPGRDARGQDESPAGFGGGQGRTPQEVEDTASAALWWLTAWAVITGAFIVLALFWR